MQATCRYSFNDTTIPVEIKTFRVRPLENRAQYINTQLAPNLTERLKQKIIGTTRLRQTNDDDAHYDIGGTVTQYYVTTVNIQNQTSATNRLNVGFHLVFRNTLDATKNFEVDLTRTVDYPATQTLQEAENSITTTVVQNLTDEIFNKIFSNW